jgi:hypothetical protein
MVSFAVCFAGGEFLSPSDLAMSRIAKSIPNKSEKGDSQNLEKLLIASS